MDRILHARVPILKFRDVSGEAAGVTGSRWWRRLLGCLALSSGFYCPATFTQPPSPARPPTPPGLDFDVGIGGSQALFKSTMLGLLALVGARRAGG